MKQPTKQMNAPAAAAVAGKEASPWAAQDDLDQTIEPIHWLSIIFIPFNPTFQLIVLACAFVKAMTGPMTAAFDFIHSECTPELDDILFIKVHRLVYRYVCDAVYFVDFFLHIAHRQVQEEALKRVHLPKPGLFLFLDVIAMIPIYQMFQTTMCPEVKFWPNVLAFNESVLIYRFVEYFAIVSTHSIKRYVVGILLLSILMINWFTMLYMITSFICMNCENVTTWKKTVLERMPDSFHAARGGRFLMYYIYGAQMLCESFFDYEWDDIGPRTLRGMIYITILTTLGLFVKAFIFEPKIFGEILLRMRRFYAFYHRAERVVGETRRRNPNPRAINSVEKFYNLIWKERQGLTLLTSNFYKLPLYMKTDIMMDLAWPLFHHSPILRGTSAPFKRHTALLVNLSYRMPNEPFIVDPPGSSQMYYLKTGVIHILSAEDPVTPLISLSGGTLLGDVCHYMARWDRKVRVKCATYCEVLTLSRNSLLVSMHLFPIDRRMIMQKTQERFKHARLLVSCKKKVGCDDRVDSEGIQWLKKRWWQLTLAMRKLRRSRHIENKFLPGDDSLHHCCKFIGQIVISSMRQLKNKPIFIRDKFPYVLSPQSAMIANWRRFVVFTVILILVVYSPNITRLDDPRWFKIFMVICDSIFLFDLLLGLVTACEQRVSRGQRPGFVTTVFSRVKTFSFYADLFSTNLFDGLVNNQFIYFNRFIKLYILFDSKYTGDWTIGKNRNLIPFYRIVLIYGVFDGYVFPYFYQLLVRSYTNLLDVNFWFGKKCTKEHYLNCTDEKLMEDNLLIIIRVWLVELMFGTENPTKVLDSVFIIFCVLKSFILATILRNYLEVVTYLNFKSGYEYQSFVRTFEKLLSKMKIHPDLMIRLTSYFECHWKYYRGMDVMDPHVLKDEPHDVYYRLHGEVAERIISSQPPFESCDSVFIRQLTSYAQYLILPKGTTIVLFGANNEKISWLVKGWAYCEYFDDDGEKKRLTVCEGTLLSRCNIFLGFPAMRTYVTATDCEILYVTAKDFKSLLKNNPDERLYFNTCVKEIGPMLDDLLTSYGKKHKEYQQNIREKVFTNQLKSFISFEGSSDDRPQGNFATLMYLYHNYRTDPESKFMRIYMPVRAVLVFITIMVSSAHGVVTGAQLEALRYILYCTSSSIYFDILVKSFAPFYNKQGIVVSDWHKTLTHYASRGLLFDVLPLLPWGPLVGNQALAQAIDNFTRYFRIYLITGYLEYLLDTANASFLWLKMIKYQLILFLTLFVFGHNFIMSCLIIENNEPLWVNEFCWTKSQTEEKINVETLRRRYLYCLDFAQSGMLMVVAKQLGDNDNKITTAVFYLAAGLITWVIKAKTIAALVLAKRGSSLFQHSLAQLKRYLQSELIEKKFIDHCIDYLSYSWTRNRGIDRNALLTERLGEVFRQDLNFYFYKHVLVAFDQVLNGGESLLRALAHLAGIDYYLPGSEIAREMDLTSFIFIVFRGRVIITKNGTKLVTLSPGSAFGQFDSPKLRPLQVTATADDHVDCLKISLEDFHAALTTAAYKNLMASPSVTRDFVMPHRKMSDNPYNTVRYLLRGDLIIKFPRMQAWESLKHKWLHRWIFLVEVICPLAICSIIPLEEIIPDQHLIRTRIAIYITDFIQIVHCGLKFFQMELVVHNSKLTMKYIHIRHFGDWKIYVDIISLLVPFANFYFYYRIFEYFRILRIYNYKHFYQVCSMRIQASLTKILVKCSMVLLLVHVLTCICVLVYCFNTKEKAKFLINEAGEISDYVKKTIDPEWGYIKGNEDKGCFLTLYNVLKNETVYTPVMTKHNWIADYFLSFNVVVSAFVGLNSIAGRAISDAEIITGIVMGFILCFAFYWTVAEAICVVLTYYHELYEYDYHVSNLILYLKHNMVCPAIIWCVETYSTMMWQRQKGNSLPELVYDAPYCFRQDLFGELYMHHLTFHPLYRELPPYILRQILTYVKRLIMRPSRWIGKEGDVRGIQYFVHEGEVEKWQTDSNGEPRLLSLLTTSSYFGTVPCLFPKIPWMFSFYSRTVVDMRAIFSADLAAVMKGYPEESKKLYERAVKFKAKTFGRHDQGDFLL